MIKLICVGSIKENYLKDAIDDYLTRIKKYTKIELIEVKDSKIEEKALLDEEKEILKHIKDKDYVITLEIDGNMKDSISFSNYLEKSENYFHFKSSKINQTNRQNLSNTFCAII